MMSTKSRTTHRPAKIRQAGDIDTFAAPLSVSGSCVLSEDYFLTDQVIMNTGDVLRPFARADGTVEALVLSRGVLSHLSRSVTETSGWAYTALPKFQLPLPVEVVDVAVGTAPDGTVRAVLLVLIDDIASATDSFWATLGSSGTWEYQPAGPVPADLDKLQSGVDPAGNIYFYAFATASTTSAKQGSFVLWQPQSSPAGTLNTSLAGLDVADARLLWNPGYSASSSAGGVLALTSQQILEWHPQISANGFDQLPNWTDDVAAALLWASWSADPIDHDPSYVAQGSDGTVYYTDVQSEPTTLAVLPSIGSDQVAVWFASDLFSFAMLTGGTLNILAQYGDPGINDNQFTPAIPISADVLGVCGLPSDPAQATLFVVNDDATLSVLTKSPVTDAAGTTTDAWLSVPVRQASQEAQELDCWRAQLTVQDANGVPVPGTDLAVTADRPVGIWQASGNTELAAGSPVTLTTDPAGRVTFAFPATQLDSAVLSVQVMQNGVPTGNPVTVQPDGDVHAFLAGTGALNDLGTLTAASSGATALLEATDSAGKPLFPVLASLSGSDRVAASNGIATAINQAMLAGLGVKPGANDTQSFLLDVSKTVPSYTVPAPAGASAGVESFHSWWDGVKHDAESAYHGVRNGVIKVENCVGTWAADAEQWTLNLGIAIGDDVKDVVNVVVTDVRSAIHAISGIFHALGADIKSAVNWLRQNVGELIKVAGQNAKLVEGWLEQVPGIVKQHLTQYGNLAQGYFAALETTIDNDIDNDLLPPMKTRTFGNPAGVSRPGIPGVDAAAFDMEKFLSSVQHNWLLDKIMSFYSGDTQPAVMADVQAAATQAGQAAQAAWHFLEDIENLLWTGLKDLFDSRDSYDAATFAQLFGILKSAVHDLLAFADAVVQALLDLAKAVMDELADMLTHQINEIPVVGSLLRLFGVDDTMSIDHLTSLVLMYPATLANRIKNGSGAQLFPGTGASGDLVAAQLNWGPGLQISAAVGQGVWGAADAMADTFKAGGQEAPGMIGWIDIVAPIILNILQWPGAPNGDGSIAPPFVNSIDSSGKDDLLILPTWLLGWVPPVAGLCGQFADYKPTGAEDGEGDGAGEDWPEIGQYFTMASAIGATITGSIYNFQTGQSSNTQAAGILGNVSNIIAPFATKELTESTEGLSDVIKLIVDFAGNIGAAVAMGT